jgi:hypothetical protein
MVKKKQKLGLEYVHMMSVNNRGLKEIKHIFTIPMLDYFPHMSQCLSSGEDRILSPLNKNTVHLFSGSLSFSLSGFF